MSEAEHMAPNTSPGTVSAKAGVRRVNNVPIMLMGGVLMAFVIMMMIVAADRSEQQNAPKDAPKEKAGNTSIFAQEIAGNQTGGMIAPVQSIVPPEEAEQAQAVKGSPILIAKPENRDEPPRLSKGGDLQQPAHDDEAVRIRMAKLQMLEEAVKARTTVNIIAPRSSGSAPGGIAGSPANRNEMLAEIAAVRQKIADVQRDDPSSAYQARLAQIRGTDNGNMGGGGAALLTQNSGGNSGGNDIKQFQNGDGSDRWKLDAKPEAPRSPYEVRAGFVIPATLISGINSELPGQIMAQISQNVYDTATGRHLLFPQGSRLFGAYSSDVVYGQSSVLVAWQRIIYPDGKAMDIGAMPGADSAGYAGFRDQVNNHYMRLFGSAILMSGVTAGITLTQDSGADGDNASDKQRASDAMSEALGQQLGQVTAQLIAKNMNIAPTLEIRPGYRFNIIVTKDMTFSKPYKSFDY